MRLEALQQKVAVLKKANRKGQVEARPAKDATAHVCEETLQQERMVLDQPHQQAASACPLPVDQGDWKENEG